MRIPSPRRKIRLRRQRPLFPHLHPSPSLFLLLKSRLRKKRKKLNPNLWPNPTNWLWTYSAPSPAMQRFTLTATGALSHLTPLQPYVPAPYYTETLSSNLNLPNPWH